MPVQDIFSFGVSRFDELLDFLVDFLRSSLADLRPLAEFAA